MGPPAEEQVARVVVTQSQLRVLQDAIHHRRDPNGARLPPRKRGPRGSRAPATPRESHPLTPTPCLHHTAHPPCLPLPPPPAAPASTLHPSRTMLLPHLLAIPLHHASSAMAVSRLPPPPPTLPTAMESPGECFVQHFGDGHVPVMRAVKQGLLRFSESTQRWVPLQ